jgi:3-oxoadipate enol-lactonase
MKTSATTRIGDIDVHYTIEGEGPWITLAHSLACDVSMWDEQAALLSKNYRVLRYDARGHGKTTAPAGPYTLAQLADDVHGLFQHLGITRTHWVGISMGGMIGQTYALEHPGVFASMVLADTTSRRPPNADAVWGERIVLAQTQGMGALVESTLARWFTAGFRASHPDVVAPIAAGILATPVNGFCGCCAAIATIDTLDRLHEITCPVLVMVGEHDHGTPPEMARQIHANLPNSQFVLIKDAAHIANIEQPAVFNRSLMDFLAQQS